MNNVSFYSAWIRAVFSNSKYYSDIAKGRQIGVMVDTINDTVPIVRTTTPYTTDPVKFFLFVI